MTHRNVSDPDVILLVTLLRTEPFVSLRKSGVFCDRSIRGLEIESSRFVGLLTLTAGVRDESRMISVDIMKWRS